MLLCKIVKKIKIYMAFWRLICYTIYVDGDKHGRY